jgi:hypothetical protein
MHPERACQRAGFNRRANRKSAALSPRRGEGHFGPVSGGVAVRHRPATGWVTSGNRSVVSQGATNRLMAEVPPGNRPVAVWFLKGTKRVAGVWLRSGTPGLWIKGAMHPERACQRAGFNRRVNRKSAALSPRRGEGPFGPVSGGVAGRHRPATGWVPSGNLPVVSRGATNRLMAEVPPGNLPVVSRGATNRLMAEVPLREPVGWLFGS